MEELSKISEDDLDVMHLLQKDPTVSQRVISSKLGLSLGKVNYSLKSLADIGFIKLKNFRDSKNKLSYLYILTPSGIAAKSIITKKFLLKKLNEYEKLHEYLNEPEDKIMKGEGN